MTDGDALLANVVAADCRTAEEKIARWADDAPRKVYADWLMEHGQEERGRYIIFALDYDYHRELGEGDGGHVTDTEWEPEADCWPCMSWPDSLSTLTRLPAKELAKWKFEWRRGFVHSLTCTAANWLAHADAIVTRHPVREVRLTTFSVVVSGGGRNRGLSRLDGRKKWHSNETLLFETMAKQLCEMEWHGITFHLPEPAADGYWPLEDMPAEELRVGDPVVTLPRVRGRVRVREGEST